MRCSPLCTKGSSSITTPRGKGMDSAAAMVGRKPSWPTALRERCAILLVVCVHVRGRRGQSDSSSRCIKCCRTKCMPSSVVTLIHESRDAAQHNCSCRTGAACLRCILLAAWNCQSLSLRQLLPLQRAMADQIIRRLSPDRPSSSPLSHRFRLPSILLPTMCLLLRAGMRSAAPLCR